MKRTSIILTAATLLCLSLSSCFDDIYGNSDSGDGTGSHDDDNYVTSGPWVDLGLPSGLLWASCNVGAEYPEQYGNYYAWGETTTKIEYNWNTYKYCYMDGSNTKLTKYCNDGYNWGYNGFADNLTTLQPEDDAATANLGGGARTPYSFEWQELIDRTTQEVFTLYGIEGVKFTASNGNSIFIPGAGYRENGLLSSDGYIYCQSASLKSNLSVAPAQNYPYDYVGIRDVYMERCKGLPVRAVRAK